MTQASTDLAVVESTSVECVVDVGGGIVVTTTGAIIKGHPSIEEFCAAMQGVSRLANACTWAIGDLLVYGEGRGDYGEEYSQAIELTQKSYSTLTKAAKVSRAFPPSDREFARDLSWTHHYLATKIKDAEERRSLLKQCVAQALSREELDSIIPKALPKEATTGEAHEIECPYCNKRFTV